MVSVIKSFIRSPEFYKPLFIFLLTRVFLFSLSSLVLHSLGFQPSIYNTNSTWPAYISENKFIEGFTRYDGAWYLDIARNGYSYSATEMSNIAFFPLYPLLIRYLARIIPDYYIAGILLSNFSLLIALVLLFALVKRKLNERVAFRTTLLISIFPFSFFLSAVYTESLFLLITLIVFYLFEKKRWILAAAAIAAASTTRIQGTFLIPILAFLLYREGYLTPGKLKPKALLSILLASIGLMSFLLFNQIKFGSPFGFAEAQTQWVLRNSIPNFSTHLYAVSILLGQQSPRGVFDILLVFNLVLVAIWSALLPKINKILGPEYLFFTIFTLTIPLLSSLVAIERFVLTAFPGFVALALVKKQGFYLIALISASFLTLWATFFFIGYPVF